MKRRIALLLVICLLTSMVPAATAGGAVDDGILDNGIEIVDVGDQDLSDPLAADGIELEADALPDELGDILPKGDMPELELGDSLDLPEGETLPSESEAQGDASEANDDSSDFTIENGVLTKYNGAGGDVVIPDGVTAIGDGAFYEQPILSITIPNSVKRIGRNAFGNCWMLKSIVIPDSVTEINEMAFNSCTALKEIAIPGGLTRIADSMFIYCSALTTVQIPDSVTEIGNEAFEHCGELSDVRFSDGLTSIGYGAFNGCSKLSSVTLPDSLKSIGEYAFDSSGLTAVTIPKNVTVINEFTFESCRNLTEVVIPNGVTHIKANAFWGCQKLQKVTIPDSVVRIGQEAFEYCSSLEEAIIPRSVTKITMLAFDKCEKLAIKGFTGSAAEKYANENGIPFVAIDEPAPEISIPKALTLGVKETYALDAAGASFKSSNATVVAVDKKGVVTAKKAGSATVTVTVSGKKVGSCKVTVVKAPTEVSFAEKAVTLGVKETLALKPTITKGSHTSYTWSVKDKKIATVDKDGVVTGKKAGKTTVTVKTHNGKKATVTVTVQKAPTKVSLPKKAVTLGVKEALTLTPKIAKGAHTSYTWTVADSKIATVTKSGKVTGKKAGETTVTVKTHNGKKATVTVTVMKAPTAVSLEAKTMALGVKESVKLKPEIARDAHTSYTWTVKDKKIAAVTADGKLTGKKAGKTTVTVKTHNGKKATMTVQVMNAPSQVSLGQKSLTMKAGELYVLDTTFPEKTASYKLRWSSSNKKVATVNENGVVIGVNKGKAKITVKTFNNKKAVCTVTVKNADQAEAGFIGKIPLINTEGVEDSASKKTIEKINKSIEETNASITEYNKKDVASLEGEVYELSDLVSSTSIQVSGGNTHIDNNGIKLSIGNKLFEKLSNGEDIEMLDATDNEILMKIGGINCKGYFAGDVLHIEDISSNHQTTNSTKEPLHVAANFLTDSDYENSRNMLEVLNTKPDELEAKIKFIAQTLDTAINNGEKIAAKYKKAIDAYIKVMADNNKPDKVKKLVQNCKYATQLRLDEITDKLNILRALRVGIRGVDINALKKHITELASRWEESLTIYKEYHLQDKTVLDNYLLKKSAEELDMYIHRLWLNYKVDVVLTLVKLVSISTAISIDMCKIFSLKFASLEKIAAALTPGGLLKVALVELFNYTHSQLYKRNYQYMKDADDKLHSYIDIKVTDEDTGRPLEDVMITWTNRYSTEVRYTDANGFFHFHLYPGSWELSFVLPGYKSVEINSAQSSKGYAPLGRDTISIPVKMKNDGIPVDSVHFPDDAFKAVVAGFDLDENWFLSNEEIEKVKSLNIDSKGIASLEGIQYLIALEELSCASNKLTELNVSGCTDLNTLNCSYNNLTFLNISGRANLQKLFCNSNKLTGLNCGGLSMLTDLNCGDNQLTTLDVSGYTALQVLNCSVNQLTGLNVSTCTQLRSLYCSNNKINELNLLQNKYLDDLQYDNNPIELLLWKDRIVFGHYEQDNNLLNGKEPIEWRVLKENGNTLTLISEYGLDAKPYHTEGVAITWQNCSLRAWLNGSFLNSAFTSAGQAKLQTVTVKAEDNPRYGIEAGNDTQDKVYLLSISEANSLLAGNSDRQCKPTAYARAQGAFTSTNSGNCWWWLRSPGDDSSNAADVADGGGVLIGGSYVTYDFEVVRPVVCLRLS